MDGFGHIWELAQSEVAWDGLVVKDGWIKYINIVGDRVIGPSNDKIKSVIG